MFGKRRKIRERIKDEYGKKRDGFACEGDKSKLDLIKLYHQEMEECGSSGEIDDITWNDLQMDDVFASVNFTRSFIGEQSLYHKLHCTENRNEELEQKIQVWTENEDVRIDMEERLASIGKSEDSYYYLASFLMHAELWKISNTFLIHFMQGLLLAAIAVGCIFRSDWTLLLLVPICAANLLVYLRTKNQYEGFLFSLGTLKQIIEFGNFIVQSKVRDKIDTPEEIVGIVKDLTPIARKIMGWQGRKNAAVYGDFAAILSDYIYGTTLLDVSLFNYIMKRVDGKQNEIMKLFEYIGEIDVSIAVASYRKSLEEYCVPVLLTEETSEFHIQGLVHPLLEKPIENDFRLKNRAIITGANAAGKSTFLKALAINVIFAKSIHTCTAKYFQMPDVIVMTSMALRDDIISGESYYIREAKRIRQMLELEKQGKYSLLIVDEMLKGTNTSERVSASIAILSYLAKTHQKVIVATHDAVIGSQLSSVFERFYFDSIITDEKIMFDYKIHSGNGGRTNAIELLSHLKYPDEIVKQAREELGKYHEN